MTQGPIALVTGAAQGLGLASAEALQADGARVVLADVKADAVRAAAERIGALDAAVCDMGAPDEIAAMFDDIEARHGPVSILVNNAGIARPADFLDVTLEDFRRVIDVNLTGSFVALQRAARAMVAGGIEGAIVNMSSINAVVAIPAIAAYCASKGGIAQLTKVAALALAPHGIRVNAVAPGSIDTEMMAGVNADPGAMDKVLSRTPLKRIGTPAEIGAVVAFLASPRASYVTGTTVAADGGRLGLNYTC